MDIRTMGTWSHEAFGNDQACDWAAEVKESTGFTVIEQAFDQVIMSQDEDFIDADIGSVAHAAAEVLAHILGQGTQDIDFIDGLNQWIDQLNTQASATLIQKAIQALDILTHENSELDELWQESNDYADWTKNLEELKETLNSKL